MKNTRNYIYNKNKKRFRKCDNKIFIKFIDK